MADRKNYAEHQYDFEIGCLVKSPCRQCWEHHRFPACSSDCDILDQIQTLLARSVLSTRNYSNMEAFSIYLETWKKK